MEIDIEAIAEQTLSAIEEMCSEDRAEKVKDVIIQLQDTYFSAPASSNENYHSCYDGGFAVHNLNVLKNLRTMNDSLNLGFNEETMCVVALFHDIGKASNTEMEEFYVHTSDNWRRKNGSLYEYNSGKVYFPTNIRSMWLLQELNFKLTAEEYQAILLNDGMHIEGNRVFMNKQSKLSAVLHMADYLASFQEKEAQTQAE